MVSVSRKIVVERRIAIVRTALLVPQKPLKSLLLIELTPALPGESILSIGFALIEAELKLVVNAFDL
jgi:hypothetical protein